MYGKGEAGADVVEYLTYTVSDGIATVDYKGQKITTTKIENDTFKASLDGTEENTASFTTKANPAPAKPETPVKPADPEKPTEPTDPEKPTEPTDPEKPAEPTDPEKPAEPTDPETPVEPTDPEKPVEPTDPEKPVENPFAGKTFYGTVTEWPYDVCKLDFTSDSEVTLTLYGEGEAGADVVLDLTYTVSDGIATVDYEGQKLTTTKIENDTFKASLDGTEENTASFTTNANPAPAEPETPVEPVLKTAAGYNCTKGKGELEWVDGVAVLQFELPANYVNNWIYPDNPNNSFSFYLETVAGSWQDDCYKAAQTVEIGGEAVDLEIGKAGNNTVTSAESLAGKTLKLTFTGTETAIKCKAEIVE